jgi:hypothetical protein
MALPTTQVMGQGVDSEFGSLSVDSWELRSRELEIAYNPGFKHFDAVESERQRLMSIIAPTTINETPQQFSGESSAFNTTRISSGDSKGTGATTAAMLNADLREGGRKTSRGWACVQDVTRRLSSNFVLKNSDSVSSMTSSLSDNSSNDMSMLRSSNQPQQSISDHSRALPGQNENSLGSSGGYVKGKFYNEAYEGYSSDGRRSSNASDEDKEQSVPLLTAGESSGESSHYASDNGNGYTGRDYPTSSAHTTPSGTSPSVALSRAFKSAPHTYADDSGGDGKDCESSYFARSLFGRNDGSQCADGIKPHFFAQQHIGAASAPVFAEEASADDHGFLAGSLAIIEQIMKDKMRTEC